MKVRNPVRKISGCFLYFLHPSLTLNCSIWLEGKSLPNTFHIKYHQMEQKESWICPWSIPTLKYVILLSQSLGYRETTISKMSMLFVEGGSQSVSGLGCFRGQFGRGEVILQFDDVVALVAIPAYRPLSCSLSLLAGFHAIGHNTCGWIKAGSYKQHWRPEHSWGGMVVFFKAQHWSDLQQVMHAGDGLSHRWGGKGALVHCTE